MKKIFIDCGAFRGSIIKKFLRDHPAADQFKVYAFECNPALDDYEYDFDCERIKKAVYVNDGTIDFFLSKTHKNIIQGSSIFKEKKTGNLDTEKPVTAETINFSRWIKETFSPDDYIIIKMNIEGSEYPVINDLINTGAMKYVDEICVKWHWQKINLMVLEHIKTERLLKNSGVKYYTDYRELCNG